MFFEEVIMGLVDCFHKQQANYLHVMNETQGATEVDWLNWWFHWQSVGLLWQGECVAAGETVLLLPHLSPLEALAKVRHH